MAKPRNTPKRTTPKPAPSEAAPKRRAGRPANPNTQPLPPVTGLRLPLDLLDALDAYVEKRNAELDWKADSWRLEKFFPGEFGSKVSHEVSGPAGGPIEVSDARAKLLAKLAPKPEPGGSG